MPMEQNKAGLYTQEEALRIRQENYEKTQNFNAWQQAMLEQAMQLHIPHKGTFELTPFCSMKCKMCYMRLDPPQAAQQGRLLTAEEWIRLGKMAFDAGTVDLLLTGGEPKLHVYCLTRAGQGVGIDRRKEYQYQSLAYNFGNKVAEPFFVTAGAVPAGTPLVVNCHDGQEFDYVMEGTLRFIVNGTEMVLNPGDSIYFNSGYPHGIQAVGDKPAKFLAIVL